ncbi:hypothetical protein CR513_49452, partial [Mucuna pruriens]
MALSKFLSQSIEMVLPIFQTLKKGESFLWTIDSEEAFQRLKAMLATPPILTRPTPSIPLLVYISVTDDAISVTIVQEKEGSQCPVYFISLERRYQKIEKASLALIIISRRLCPYFQHYNIIIRTDLPIRQILQKLVLAGRMVGWSVQLSKFDISFKRRGNEGKEWLLFVDRASNQSESGVGIILEGPKRVLIEQSLLSEFKANNNQAEYEALLATMRLAKELDAQILTAKSDSKLVLQAR